MKSSVQARIDTTIKQEAEEVLANIGLDTTTAIRLFFHKIASTRSIPFELKEEPYAFSFEEEQEVLAAEKEAESGVVAITDSVESSQEFLDSLK